MPAHSQPGGSSGHLQIRRALTQSSEISRSDHGPSDAMPDLVTDSLVDKVVERIERRVIEELERRGQRQGRGQY